MYLAAARTAATAALGKGILARAPWLMKFLSIAGTAAMFLVGGGILVHAVPSLAHWIEAAVPQGWVGGIVLALANAMVGLAVGAVVVAAVAALQKLRRGRGGKETGRPSSHDLP